MSYRLYPFIKIILVVAIVIISGCETNPVTDKNQFSFVSSVHAIAICGQQNGSRQPSPGGAFIVDPARNKYVDSIGQRLVALNGESDLSYAFVVLNNDIPNS